jgi:predicted Zn-dependent protease
MNSAMSNKNTKNIYLITILGAFTVLIGGYISACSKGGGVNIFSVDDDVKLGKQLAQEINNDPATYPLLDEVQYATAYSHLRRITDALLNTGEINYRDKFEWKIKIIKDDATLNAFCAPGGYIYVYTGLIKFLDKESELAGVMGHEIAHADLRHSTDRLTTAYGLDFLLGLILGKNSSSIKDVAANLALLSYSRKSETQADEYSVRYLCKTDYQPNGTAGFFQKLVDSGQGGKTPAWLSTHPAPDKRVQNINKWAEPCGTGQTFESRYLEFKSSLP